MKSVARPRGRPGPGPGAFAAHEAPVDGEIGAPAGSGPAPFPCCIPTSLGFPRVADRARIRHTFLKKTFWHRAHRGPNRGHGAKHLVRSVASVGWAPCPCETHLVKVGVNHSGEPVTDRGRQREEGRRGGSKSIVGPDGVGSHRDERQKQPIRIQPETGGDPP